MVSIPAARRDVAAWTFLAVYAALAGVLLWPAGLGGQRFGLVVAGALLGSAAVRCRGAIRELLWWAASILLSGPTIIAVSHGPFGFRHAAGAALLIALLLFGVGTSSGRPRAA